MSSSLPSPIDDYKAPAAMALTEATWDAALTSVGARLRALEAVRSDFEALIALGTGQALEVIAANVAPQLEAVRATIDQLTADAAAAEDIVAAINSGSIPASVIAETAARIWLTPTLRDAWNGKQPGDPTLSALAALETVADRLVYASGADTFAVSPLTALARTLLGRATGAEMLETLGAAASEATATALAKRLRFDDAQTLTADEKTRARSNLGLGTASVRDVGTVADSVVVLGPEGELPEVDGSKVTGVIPAIPIRAYAAFKWSGTAVEILASANIASIVRTGVGDYTITFAAPMPSAHYAISSAVAAAGGSWLLSPYSASGVGAPALMTTTQVRLVVYAYGAGFADPAYASFQIVGG
jgi:hypothetical protein